MKLARFFLCWTFFLLFLVVYQSHKIFAQDNQDSNDIEGLLGEANQALSGKKPDKEEADKKEQPPSKNSSKKAKPSISQDQGQEEVKSADQPLDRKAEEEKKQTLQAMKTSGLDKILQLNMEKLNQEQRVSDPVIVSQVSLAGALLDQGKIFTKDDDTFSLNKKTLLKGVMVAISPSWQWERFSNDLVQTRSILSMGGGYFYGETEVKRSGVENEINNYQYRILPVEAEGGMSLRRSALSLNVLYGLGWEMVTQNGLGESDTVSDFFVNDLFTIQLVWHLTKTWEAETSWQDQKLGLFDLARSYHSQVFTIGLRIITAG